MRLTFIQMKMFEARWRRLGLSDAELAKLESQLMQNPEAGRAMRDTGGVRKLRFAPEGRGKSGAFRVCYAYFASHAQVFMFIIFGKNEQENLTASQRRELQRLMSLIKRMLHERGIA